MTLQGPGELKPGELAELLLAQGLHAPASVLSMRHVHANVDARDIAALGGVHRLELDGAWMREGDDHFSSDGEGDDPDSGGDFAAAVACHVRELRYEMGSHSRYPHAASVRELLRSFPGLEVLELSNDDDSMIDWTAVPAAVAARPPSLRSLVLLRDLYMGVDRETAQVIPAGDVSDAPLEVTFGRGTGSVELTGLEARTRLRFRRIIVCGSFRLGTVAEWPWHPVEQQVAALSALVAGGRLELRGRGGAGEGGEELTVHTSNLARLGGAALSLLTACHAPRVVLVLGGASGFDDKLVHALPACVRTLTLSCFYIEELAEQVAAAAARLGRPIAVRLLGCSPEALASAHGTLGPEAAGRVQLTS